MDIEVYMSKDKTKFGGNIDGKEFDFTVEEFVNLIGAFQRVAAEVQGIEVDEDDIVSTDNLKSGNKKI